MQYAADSCRSALLLLALPLRAPGPHWAAFDMSWASEIESSACARGCQLGWAACPSMGV